MSSIGDGFSDQAIEQNVDIALIQARVQGVAQQAAQVRLPATGFVAQLNGQDGAINIQAGTSSPGVTVNVTNGVGTISIGVVGFGALATVKCNAVGAAPPAVTDDSGSGYAIFSTWIDQSGGPDIYMCTDPAVGVAVWIRIG